MYFNSWSAPASICDSNPFAVAVIEWSSLVFTIVPEITPLIDVPVAAPWLILITGLSRLVKSIRPLPADSTEFRIPSLSKSKSILSIIPSLSESVAQILIGISSEFNSILHSKIPLSLYVPDSVGV